MVYYFYWIKGFIAGYRLYMKGRAGDMQRLEAVKENSRALFGKHKKRQCAWHDGFHKTSPPDPEEGRNWK